MSEAPDDFDMDEAWLENVARAICAQPYLLTSKPLRWNDVSEDYRQWCFRLALAARNVTEGTRPHG